MYRSERGGGPPHRRSPSRGRYGAGPGPGHGGGPSPSSTPGKADSYAPGPAGGWDRERDRGREWERRERPGYDADGGASNGAFPARSEDGDGFRARRTPDAHARPFSARGGSRDRERERPFIPSAGPSSAGRRFSRSPSRSRSASRTRTPPRSRSPPPAPSDRSRRSRSPVRPRTGPGPGPAANYTPSAGPGSGGWQRDQGWGSRGRGGGAGAGAGAGRGGYRGGRSGGETRWNGSNAGERSPEDIKPRISWNERDGPTSAVEPRHLPSQVSANGTVHPHWSLPRTKPLQPPRGSNGNGETAYGARGGGGAGGYPRRTSYGERDMAGGRSPFADRERERERGWDRERERDGPRPWERERERGYDERDRRDGTDRDRFRGARTRSPSPAMSAAPARDGPWPPPSEYRAAERARATSTPPASPSQGRFDAGPGRWGARRADVGGPREDQREVRSRASSLSGDQATPKGETGQDRSATTSILTGGGPEDIKPPPTSILPEGYEKELGEISPDFVPAQPAPAPAQSVSARPAESTPAIEPTPDRPITVVDALSPQTRARKRSSTPTSPPTLNEDASTGPAAVPPVGLGLAPRPSKGGLAETAELPADEVAATVPAIAPQGPAVVMPSTGTVAAAAGPRAEEAQYADTRDESNPREGNISHPEDPAQEHQDVVQRPASGSIGAESASHHDASAEDEGPVSAATVEGTSASVPAAEVQVLTQEDASQGQTDVAMTSPDHDAAEPIAEVPTKETTPAPSDVKRNPPDTVPKSPLSSAAPATGITAEMDVSPPPPEQAASSTPIIPAATLPQGHPSAQEQPVPPGMVSGPTMPEALTNGPAEEQGVEEKGAGDPHLNIASTPNASQAAYLASPTLSSAPKILAASAQVEATGQDEKAAEPESGPLQAGEDASMEAADSPMVQTPIAEAPPRIHIEEPVTLDNDDLVEMILARNNAMHDKPISRSLDSPVVPEKVALDFALTEGSLSDEMRAKIVADELARKKAYRVKVARLRREYAELEKEWEQSRTELERENEKYKADITLPSELLDGPAAAAINAALAGDLRMTTGPRVRATRTATANLQHQGALGFADGDEAAMERALLLISQADQADPTARALRTEAVVPDMLLEGQEKLRLVYDDETELVEDPLSFYDNMELREGAWTAEEDAEFRRLFAQQPKQFGHIAKGLPGRSVGACVEHYYMTKKIRGYKELTVAAKTGPRRLRGKESALSRDLNRRKKEDPAKKGVKAPAPETPTSEVPPKPRRPGLGEPTPSDRSVASVKRGKKAAEVEEVPPEPAPEKVVKKPAKRKSAQEKAAAAGDGAPANGDQATPAPKRRKKPVELGPDGTPLPVKSRARKATDPSKAKDAKTSMPPPLAIGPSIPTDHNRFNGPMPGYFPSDDARYRLTVPLSNGGHAPPLHDPEAFRIARPAEAVKQEPAPPPPARRGMDIMSLLNSEPAPTRAQTVPPVESVNRSPASDATEEDRDPSKAGTWSAPPAENSSRYERPSTASTVADDVLPHWATTTLKPPAPYPAAAFAHHDPSRISRPSSAASAPGPVYYEQQYRGQSPGFGHPGQRQDTYMHPPQQAMSGPHPGYPAPMWQPQPAPAYASRYGQPAIPGPGQTFAYRQEMREGPAPGHQDPQMPYPRPAIPSLGAFSLSRGGTPHDGRTSR